METYCMYPSPGHPINMNMNMKTTLNNGSLGSCIDEERGEMRKAMRTASTARHEVFERKWHRRTTAVCATEDDKATRHFGVADMGWRDEILYCFTSLEELDGDWCTL
jgi:hypothetical protein